MGRGRLCISFVLTLLLLGNALGKSLSGFEGAVAKPHSSSASRSHGNDCDDDDVPILDDLFDDCANQLFPDIVLGLCLGVKWLAYDWWANPEGNGEVIEEAPLEESLMLSEPVVVSTNKAVVLDKVSAREVEVYADDPETIESPEVDPLPGDGLDCKWGTMASPFIRFDYQWQYLDAHSHADTYTLEVGYKALAFLGRESRYKDKDADETLGIDQYYAMLRAGNSDEDGSFQVGVGLGGYVVEGKEYNSGAALTVPFSFCYRDIVGVEFRPAWAKINDRTVGDYDVSVNAGYRFIQARLGYRWLWVQGEGHWLNGPYAGMGIMF
jgi:hypothetical protein